MHKEERHWIFDVQELGHLALGFDCIFSCTRVLDCCKNGNDVPIHMGKGSRGEE
jgi:hypothetical protein